MNNMEKIAIVTDSTADIPASLTEKNQIHVVPNLVIIDGQSIEDGKGLSRRKFYESLPQMKSLPTTATASSGTYEQLYKKLFQQGFTRILSIHASSFLSGIFNSASLAAQAFKERVRVVDSQNVSLGLGFQVLAAAEAVRQDTSIENVVKHLDELRQRIHLVAMLDTLEYVRRSGRVSWARARLGELLRIKPFVEVRKGQVFSLGEARTYHKGVARLMEMLRRMGTLERLAILHTNAENEASQFLKSLPPYLPETPFIVNVTTVIGTHVGPNGLGFVAVVK
jgi:DegV family protein with EDD domain